MPSLVAPAAGADGAFERLYRLHAGDVYRYALAVLGNPSDAEDVAQMTAMGIPSTFILGPDRTLIDMAVGFSPDVEERWKKVVEKHLKARK